MTLTVRNEFKLKSKYFNCDKSLNVAGATELIPLRLRSKICKALKFSKWDESNFWIMFDDKFRSLRLPTSCNAIDGNNDMKFSDRSSFSNVDAPCKREINDVFCEKLLELWGKSRADYEKASRIVKRHAHIMNKPARTVKKPVGILTNIQGLSKMSHVIDCINYRKHTSKTSLFSWINRLPAKKISFGALRPLKAPPSMLEIRLYRKSIRSKVGCAANASVRIVPEWNSNEKPKEIMNHVVM